MSSRIARSRLVGAAVATITTAFLIAPAAAQGGGGGRGGGRGGQSGPLGQAAQLDMAGHTSQARSILTVVIDTTTDPAAKANARRAMAMSYAFDGDCANTVKYENQVIDYWRTREQAEPQNAFYQEGEMADEAARVCIDAGDLDTSERLYREGYDRGVLEPSPKTHPTSLWDFRLAHALGRLAARRGERDAAMAQIAAAKRALASDSAMASQQARFLPYLTGYVALYTGDLKTAEADLTQAIGMQGNQRDPFMHCLLAMTYEREGRQADADTMYRQAYGMATAHNPPAAFVRPFVRKKLGLTGD
jgi:tetratricopeptide (TPR) repeat protein